MEIQYKNLQQRKDIYQSEQVYSNLSRQNLEFGLDQSKEDLFGLGLSILETGLQTSIQDIYNIKGHINENILEMHYQKFKDSYWSKNPGLCEVLKIMLKIKESERPNF